MAYQVTLQPSGHQFSVQPGQTVLEAALHAGYALPYGCRNGACGACKGKVLSGRVDYGATQEGALSAAEREQGYALFCSARPLTDLVLEVHEVTAVQEIPVKTLPCRVERLERLCHDVMGIWLKLPSSERLQFLPGQYIDFLLKDGRRRSLSLANAPEEDALLELHMRYVPGGFFSEHVFNVMKVKDILRIRGPLGSFYLRESDKPAVFVAGGTGFAPIKAILTHAFNQGLKRELVLYWGARAVRDLYMPQLPERWAREHANFRFVPVIQSPLPEESWSGRTGHVHEAVLADYSDLSGVQAYVCGAPAMVAAARRDFVARGLPADEFYSDSFEFQGGPGT
ncbi:MAG: CDP-6-deoxy-delta-3,4-glucoseen reductase [Thiobacillaceae bacterium]|nr:CDP-6-deoxy-delta-3,4-glucoseen reductase [Thiobacillaceae bacterium]MCX7673471.1 CDP-6-deoxy-delta-3,4-glucoseen reductase [Thiobacillaceae bacterium]MDW8323921.1 CDP-6-deoxy-delta-3,4-glucoseen reductase [Burkholderiales bacterium]